MERGRERRVKSSAVKPAMPDMEEECEWDWEWDWDAEGVNAAVVVGSREADEDGWGLMDDDEAGREPLVLGTEK